LARRHALIVVNGLNEPSGLVRARQYQPLFERSAEWSAAFIARCSPRWVGLANRTRRPTVPLMLPLVHRPVAAYSARWERKREDEIARLAADADLVYLVKVPALSLYRRLRELRKPKVVADFNDGLWLPAFQASGWQDLDGILATADAVICENPHVAEYARRRNSSVHVVPDAPQLDRFDERRSSVQRDPSKTVLGWIGSPENVGSLFRIWEPLEALMRRHPGVELRVLGADRWQLPRFESVRFSCVPWFDQATMVQEALAFDVGLFPMYHTGDGLARGNLKAMIYMSAGAAALCEDYGENRTLIVDGDNGMLASTPDQWLDKMERLCTDRVTRERIAGRGLETIRRHFAADVVFRQLQLAFTAIVEPAASQPVAAMAAAR
jgi:glycosyltransferase involved in cell wall biosynthesis